VALSRNPVRAISFAGEAQIAQLVEQRTENPRVGGSNPPLGTNILQQIQWFIDT
jgi:hypothetical protein